MIVDVNVILCHVTHVSDAVNDVTHESWVTSTEYHTDVGHTVSLPQPHGTDCLLCKQQRGELFKMPHAVQTDIAACQRSSAVYNADAKQHSQWQAMKL